MSRESLTLQEKRFAAKKARRALEQQLHDECLQNTARYKRAIVFARTVMGMVDIHIPDSAREQAYEDIALAAFAKDVEISGVPPERDADVAAALEAAKLAPSTPALVVPANPTTS